MITRSIGIVVIGVGVLSGPAFAQFEIPAPSAPPQTLTPAPRVYSPGVKTNRTQLFSQSSLPNPLLSPGIFPTPTVTPPKAIPPIPAPPTQPASYIAWDADSKEYSAKPGDAMANFTF